MNTQTLSEVRKALVAVVAGLGILAVAVSATSDGGTTITTSEWIQVAIAALGAVGVYAIKNEPVSTPPAK